MPRLEEGRLRSRYTRLHDQLAELLQEAPDAVARMATVAAVLHHKLPHFSWTGFYRLEGGELVVGPYQGPVACAVLARHQGVCWAAVDRGEPVLVPDVHAFPGHIACDARSRSEVVLPVRDRSGAIRAVLDVDSHELDAFRPADVDGLARIVAGIYA
ncbi:MAG TPA: GAF domain-containing protein [Myxococcota bacterium]|nr:GAF domain-containing protein [Myxococcota bacterium]HRY92399.1 GAF domain-containing protein [Myxococcota bacterium]HSA22869.1 GAF domain-containing protein [Myxococcota bacterium]